MYILVQPLCPPPPPGDVNTVSAGGSGDPGAAANPSSYAARAAAGRRQRTPQGLVQPVLPIPTHGRSPLTVLIDLQSARATANRDDRSRFVLLQLGVDPLAVTSLYVEPVTHFTRLPSTSKMSSRRWWRSLGGVWLGRWLRGGWSLVGQPLRPSKRSGSRRSLTMFPWNN